MKKTIKRYTITDPKAHLYWERNFHYGYTTNNKAVFDTRFTDNLVEATLLSKKEAEDVLARFNEYDFVQTGRHKVDGKELVIRIVTLTYELEPNEISLL